MIKIHKCSYCGQVPHMMICKADDIETEYKLTHFCKNKKNFYDTCGNWYETRRMAILDWNMNRNRHKHKVLPRKNNYFLRNYEMYWPNGELKKEN